MRPYKYTENNGITTFHYRFKELRHFITQGRLTGDIGFILSQYIPNNYTRYKGFGTFENPQKDLITMTVQDCEPFDGKKALPEEVVNPTEIVRVIDSYRFVILDLSKSNKN